MASVGFKANTKALGHDNLIYFCDPCKEVTRDMWRGYRCQKEEKSVQTETDEKTEKRAKNPKEGKSSQTKEDFVEPWPSRHEGVQTESVNLNQDQGNSIL